MSALEVGAPRALVKIVVAREVRPVDGRAGARAPPRSLSQVGVAQLLRRRDEQQRVAVELVVLADHRRIEAGLRRQHVRLQERARAAPSRSSHENGKSLVELARAHDRGARRGRRAAREVEAVDERAQRAQLVADRLLAAVGAGEAEAELERVVRVGRLAPDASRRSKSVKHQPIAPRAPRPSDAGDRLALVGGLLELARLRRRAAELLEQQRPAERRERAQREDRCCSAWRSGSTSP